MELASSPTFRPKKNPVTVWVANQQKNRSVLPKPPGRFTDYCWLLEWTIPKLTVTQVYTFVKLHEASVEIICIPLLLVIYYSCNLFHLCLWCKSRDLKIQDTQSAVNCAHAGDWCVLAIWDNGITKWSCHVLSDFPTTVFQRVLVSGSSSAIWYFTVVWCDCRAFRFAIVELLQFI